MLLKRSTVQPYINVFLYPDDLLNIENPSFEQIYPAELHSSDTKAPVLDLDSSIFNGIV